MLGIAAVGVGGACKSDYVADGIFLRCRSAAARAREIGGESYSADLVAAKFLITAYSLRSAKSDVVMPFSALIAASAVLLMQ